MNERNQSQTASSEEMENKLSKLNHHDMPADEGFRDRLKSRVLEARAQKRMKRTMPGWSDFSAYFINHRFVTVGILAAIVLVAVVSVFQPGGLGTPGTSEEPRGDRFQIGAAHKDDYFKLVPDKQDALGVAVDTSFRLTSKEPVPTRVLAENLVIEPAVEIDFKEVSPTEWVIAPKGTLPANEILSFKLAASYVDDQGQEQDRDFGWAYQVKDSFKVLSSIPRHASTGVPMRSGIEVTFSHPDLADFPSYFSLTPSVPGRFEYHARTAVFVPEETLQEGTVYVMTVRKGLHPVGSDEVLAEDYVVSFETQAPSAHQGRPWVSAERDMFDFSPTETPALDVVLSEKERGAEVSARVYRLADSEAYLALLRERDQRPWWSHGYTRWTTDVSNLPVVATFASKLEHDDENSWGAGVLRFPEALPAGWYVVELGIPGATDQFFIQVSELATYVSTTKSKTLVWVNSTASKAPVAGATFEIIGYGMKATTDADGAAAFNTPEVLAADVFNDRKDERPYARIVSGTRSAVMQVAISGRNWYGMPNLEDASADWWKHFATDRPRYQSEDTIRFWGMLKSRAGRKAPAEPVSVTLYKSGYVDYYYQPIRISETAVEVDSHGTFTGQIQIDGLRPDYYTLELRVGDAIVTTQYLEIRPYEKPAFALSLTPDKKELYVGETATFTVEAKFFDGTPVPKLALTAQKQDQGTEALVTDDAGRATFTYVREYAPCPNTQYSCWPASSWFEVRSTNAELADISANASLTIYGPELYVRSETRYPSKGQAEIKLKARKIDRSHFDQEPAAWEEDWIGKEPYPNAKIDITVTKTTYVSTYLGKGYDYISKQTYDRYSYSHREDVVDTLTAATDANGEYVYRRAVDPHSSYVVNFAVHDALGRKDQHSTYLWYYDGYGEEQYNGDGSYSYYHLKLNQQEYSIGEQVEATFSRNEKAIVPVPAKRFLFAQYQDGYLTHRVQADATYRFGFEEKHAPNVHLGGVWFTGASYVVVSPAEYTWDWGGGTSARFKKSDRALKITATLDKDAYRPGQDATVTVRVEDKGGRPMAASVNLNLVDEAYYAAVGSGYAHDPLTSIYAGLPAGILFSGYSHRPSVSAPASTAEMGCFVEGTMVTMADGSKKAIEDVRPGDRILTFESPSSSRKVAATVEGVMRHVVGGYLVINGSLKVTPEHRLFANGTFMMAGSLKAGDWLVREDGSREMIESITESEDVVPVYNLTVAERHTYFAGGFYVHNDKGGGAGATYVRENFQDNGLFRVITTGGDGVGRVTFKLPDNVTSWRVTTQAVTDGLYAGQGTAKVVVTQPVFADVTIGQEYLVADRVVGRVRAYGVALASNDTAAVSVSAPSLTPDEIKASGKAFEAIDIVFPAFSAGRHEVTYTLETSKGNDAVRLPIEAVASRLLMQQVIASDRLSTSTVFRTEGDIPAVIVFTDASQNRLYRPLQSLAWSYGDRVDQRLAAKLAREILNDAFHETYTVPTFDAKKYQESGGGLTLLSYSSADLELSARLAATGPDAFDRLALRAYLFSKLENRTSTPEEVTLALYGLAALDEPVLTRLNVWRQRADLSIQDRIYIAMAAQQLGADELARSLYAEIAKKHVETAGIFAWVAAGGNRDENIRLTSLLMTLAAALDLPEHENYWNYLRENRPTDFLANLEQLQYIRSVLPRLNPGPVTVKYAISGREQTIKLTGGETGAIHVEPQEIESMRVLAVEGDVGYSVRVVKPLTSTVTSSSGISIRREYMINGHVTDTFKEDELIEVRMHVQLGSSTEGYFYQVTDLLPSGLDSVTAYDVDGQRVRFSYSKEGWNSVYNKHACGQYCIRYFARVKNKGEYLAEPALIQAYLAPEIAAFSQPATVKIE